MTTRVQKVLGLGILVMVYVTLFGGAGRTFGAGILNYVTLAEQATIDHSKATVWRTVVHRRGMPALRSHLAGDSLDSKGKDGSHDVAIVSSFDVKGEEAVYQYDFTNNADRDVKLLIVLGWKDRPPFLVGEFITGVNKPAESQTVSGSIFITLKAKEKKTFTVKDRTPAIMTVYANTFIVDKHDSAHAGYVAALYLPAWEHVFGK